MLPSKQQQQIFCFFEENFLKPLLRVPVGQCGWELVHHSCIELVFNPVPEFLQDFRIDVQPNVLTSSVSILHCKKKFLIMYYQKSRTMQYQQGPATLALL